ncbi:MAG TPA: methyltransferase domain-containing protein [Chroococcidiopsis sp.]
MGTYTYDSEFFDYIEIGSRRSAKLVIRLLLDKLSVSSVLDVGCGRGVWLDEWLNQGISDVTGVDGSYIEVDKLVIPAGNFYAANLAETLDLGRKFDLVQSLEVAEHIPEQYADTFVKNLIAHGDIVVFSAAPPGQGGEFHVNEREYSYWRDKFAQHGYQLIDFLRPQVLKQSEIEPWYRYNTMLFVRDSVVADLPADLQAFMVALSKPVKDYAPTSWKIRRQILSRLPNSVVSWIAIVKHSIVLTLYRLQKMFAARKQ